jgi:hypothetical protein
MSVGFPSHFESDVTASVLPSGPALGTDRPLQLLGIASNVSRVRINYPAHSDSRAAWIGLRRLGTLTALDSFHGDGNHPRPIACSRWRATAMIHPRVDP